MTTAHALAFVAGLFIGTGFGVFLMCLFQINRPSGEEVECQHIIGSIAQRVTGKARATATSKSARNAALM